MHNPSPKPSHEDAVLALRHAPWASCPAKFELDALSAFKRGDWAEVENCALHAEEYVDARQHA